MRTDGDRTRVGIEEREQAIAFLSEHFSAGRLTVEEFSHRCAAAGAAVTRGDLRETVTDLPRSASVGFGARLQQEVAERIHADERAAQERVAKAARQKLAAADPAADMVVCLNELANLLSSKVKPRTVKIVGAQRSQRSPEGFLVYAEDHRVRRDSDGSRLRSSAEVLLPDGRLWKSWYPHGCADVYAEFSVYESVKIGPYIVHFDQEGTLYARYRDPNRPNGRLDLAEALADIATRVIGEGEPRS